MHTLALTGGFLSENLGNIVVVLILAVVIFFIIRKMIKNKKQGKSPCGCDCGSCPGECNCTK